MSLLIPLDILIPVALVIIILIIIMWILYKKNKGLYQQVTAKRKKSSLYKKRIEEITFKNPKKDFEKLSKLSRDFFKDYFNLSHSRTFLELEKDFEKLNKKEHAKFCKLMSDVGYKGEKTKITEIEQLTNLFSEIMDKN